MSADHQEVLLERKSPIRRLSMPSGRKVRFESDNSAPPKATKKPLVRSNTVVGPGVLPKPDNYSLSGNVMDELVECGVCLDRLKSPKMLPCQHTFCQACLVAIVKGPEITCPTCRRVTHVPGGPATLPSNLYLDSLLTLLTARGGELEGGRGNTACPDRCVQCQTVGTVSMCQHCQQMLCPVCWPNHVADLRTQMETLQEQLQGALDKLSHKTQDFNDNCTKLHDCIDEAIELKIASVRKQQTKLNTEAQEILDRGEETSNQLQGKLLQAESNISFLAFDNITGDSEKVALFLEMHSLTSGLLDQVSHWGEARPTFDRDTFKIHHQEDDEEDGVEEENEEDVGESQKEDAGERQKDHGASPDVLSLHYRSRNAAPKLSVVRSGLQRPAGVVVSPWSNGYIFVAGTDNKQVLVVDRARGRVVSRLTNPNMLCPQGVACSSRRLYVTDKWNHQIHVFDSNGFYLKALGKRGNGDGQMRSPEGIAVGPNPQSQGPSEEDEDMLLYLCDTGNDRLQILRAHDGSLVKTIGIVGKTVTGKLTTELSAPTGIAVNYSKIVVADCGNRRIKVYSLSGDKMLEFGCHGGGRGQFRSPECVAVDRLGFILVGDSGNGRIQIFRPNGNLVRVLGGRTAHSCNLGWISGITITDTFDIISADNKNHGIHFF